MSAPGTTLLSVDGLTAGYGDISVLQQVSLSVKEGEIVVLLGANGAGKSTLLRAISGVLPARGEVTFAGQRLAAGRYVQRVRLGMAQVPEGRGTFGPLTVEENLLLGAHSRRWSSGEMRRRMGELTDIFPILASRSQQAAGSLSGGEQQMLAIARALMSSPRLLLVDEPSLGLAPAITQEVFAMLAQLRATQGTSQLIVEQNAHLSLGIADTAYVMESGVIEASGTADQIKNDDGLRRAYLGH